MKLITLLLCGISLASAQGALASPQDIPAGYEPVNHGKEWSVMSNAARTAYLQGLVAGIYRTNRTLLNLIPEARREEFRKKIFLMYDADVLRDVMTKLYSDPTNSYITPEALAYIARDMLDGVDVESIIRSARLSERTYHKQ